MSWKDRAALAVASMAGSEPTKPTKGASVSFVGATPAPISPKSPANEGGEEAAQHLGIAPVRAVEFRGATDRADPASSPLSGLDCATCAHLTMRQEWHTGTRKRFFWRCTKGFELLQGRNYGERTILAPEECDAFEQWGAGIR